MPNYYDVVIKATVIITKINIIANSVEEAEKEAKERVEEMFEEVTDIEPMKTTCYGRRT
jgi:activator of 2-hydroxyglutaryl-CoA dehydratase